MPQDNLLNKAYLVGRAGRDPEVKYFESGKMVCNFTIAVNRNTGNRDDPPDWFDLELWDKTAEVAKNFVTKGSLIGITGDLKFDLWNDRTTGDERSKPVIRVNRLELLSSRQEREADSGRSNGNYDDDF
jgi:single-strand DNA-binding protein